MIRAEPLVFFVSTTGSDSYPGTESQPFATLTKARDHIRNLIPAGLEQDVKVMIRGGTYSITEAITFTPLDTISENHNVTYQAYPGEEPVLSGATPITNWKSSGSVWFAELTGTVLENITFRELFVDGERRRRAREPDVGFFRVQSAGPDRRTSFQYDTTDLQDYPEMDGVELVYFHDWATSTVSVERIDPDTSTIYLLQPIGASYSASTQICHFSANPRYYVENHISFLDSPGEWYLDPKTKRIWYWPLPGENPESFMAFAPVATGLVELSGEAGAAHLVRNIHFSGIAFAHCAWGIPSGGYIEYQAGTHELRPLKPGLDIYRDRIPSAFTFRGSQNCSISNSRFFNLGGGAISVERGSKNISLTGNWLRDIGANGIMIGEMKGVPFSERTVEGEWNYWWLDHPEYLVSQIEVSNNLIEKCGSIFPGCVGIWIGVAEETHVHRNRIRDLPYSGISVGWVWNNMTTPCVGHRIEGNLISDVLQLLSDGAGIYTLGKQEGTVIRNNMIYNVHPKNGLAGNHGLFLDLGTGSILFEANIIFSVHNNACIRFNSGPYENIFKENTLVPMEGYPSFIYAPSEAVFLGNLTENPATWVAPDPSSIGMGLLPLDVDGNGIPDVWEKAYIGIIGSSPTHDADGDGATIFQEYVAGTHPLNAKSVFLIQPVPAESLLRISVPTILSAGIGYNSLERRYQIEVTENLSSGDWIPMTSFAPLTASGKTIEVSIPLQDNMKLFRVRVILEPSPISP